MEDESYTLATNVLGGDVAPDVAGLLHHHGAGSPFFLEELLRALIEQGTLIRQEGRWRLAGDPERPGSSWVPPRVTEAIPMRLTRLDPTVTMATVAVVRKLLPPPPPGSGGAPLSSRERVEALLEQAGLAPLAGGEVECAFEFPNLGTAVRGLTSPAVMVAAAQRVGDAAVRLAVAGSLAPSRTSTAGYRQRNTFRYVIASA